MTFEICFDFFFVYSMKNWTFFYDELKISFLLLRRVLRVENLLEFLSAIFKLNIFLNYLNFIAKILQKSRNSLIIKNFNEIIKFIIFKLNLLKKKLYRKSIKILSHKSSAKSHRKKTPIKSMTLSNYENKMSWFI